jgi:hypothetical protein
LPSVSFLIFSQAKRSETMVKLSGLRPSSSIQGTFGAPTGIFRA